MLRSHFACRAPHRAHPLRHPAVWVRCRSIPPPRDGTGARMKKFVKGLLGRIVFDSRLTAILLKNAAVIVAFHRVQDTTVADGLTIDVAMFERYTERASTSVLIHEPTSISAGSPRPRRERRFSALGSSCRRSSRHPLSCLPTHMVGRITSPRRIEMS